MGRNDVKVRLSQDTTSEGAAAPETAQPPEPTAPAAPADGTDPLTSAPPSASQEQKQDQQASPPDQKTSPAEPKSLPGEKKPSSAGEQKAAPAPDQKKGVPPAVVNKNGAPEAGQATPPPDQKKAAQPNDIPATQKNINPDTGRAPPPLSSTEQPDLFVTPPFAPRTRTDELIFWVGVLLLGIVAYLTVAAIIRWFESRSDTQLNDVERDIAAALRKPGLRLPKAAAEIRSLEAAAGEIISENQELQHRNAELMTRLAGLEMSADRKRAEAVATFIDHSLEAATALAADAEFVEVERSLALLADFRSAATALRQLRDGSSFGADLAAALEGGGFNTVLTTSAFLETYFADRPSWRALRLAARTSEAALASLLGEHGVLVVVLDILSVIGAGDARDAQVADSRNVRLIPAVQQIAARVARDLDSRELLIVDCPAPGWISDRIGRKRPALAVFDPATWT